MVVVVVVVVVEGECDMMMCDFSSTERYYLSACSQKAGIRD